MARNQLKDQQQRDERTEQILDAALHVFARRGLLTKISDIAVEAGVSHGHIYNYFASKEEILLQIIENGQRMFTNLLLDIERMPIETFEKLRRLTGIFIPLGRTAEVYLVLLQAQATDLLPEEAKESINNMARSNLAILIKIMEEGQREGSIRDGDARLLATLLITLMQNLSLLTLRGFQPIAEDEIDMVLNIVKKER